MFILTPQYIYMSKFPLTVKKEVYYFTVVDFDGLEKQSVHGLFPKQC